MLSWRWFRHLQFVLDIAIHGQGEPSTINTVSSQRACLIKPTIKLQTEVPTRNERTQRRGGDPWVSSRATGKANQDPTNQNPWKLLYLLQENSRMPVQYTPNSLGQTLIRSRQTGKSCSKCLWYKCAGATSSIWQLLWYLSREANLIIKKRGSAQAINTFAAR